MRVPRVGAMNVALLGSACSGPSDGAGDSAPAVSDESRVREMACSGELPAYEVCQCEATVDWSALTEDFWGNPVDPHAFQTVGLVLITNGGSVESVADSICADTLTQSDVQASAEAPAAGRTSITLPDMSFLGAPLESGAVWSLEWSSSRDIGVDLDIEMAVLLGVVDDGPTTVEVAWRR